MMRILALAALLVAAPLSQAEDPTAAMLRTLRLPVVATDAREVGVPEATVRGVLDALRRRGLPAEEAVLVLDEEVAAVHAGGHPDNFGGFVQQQLDAGHRGRALAEAIRAAHRARGIGPPPGRPGHGRDGAGPPGGRRP